MSLKKQITFTVNGQGITTIVDPKITLAEFLREELDLIGTKIGCNRGECGSCTVVVDGEAVLSCTLLALEMNGKNVLTVEGLSQEDTLHPLQEASIEYDAVQCGYCTPGMLHGKILHCPHSRARIVDLIQKKLRLSPELRQ